MSDRFKCLKPESDNSFRTNRFENDRSKSDNEIQTNSRWQRSESTDEKFNSFTSRGGGRRGGRGRGRGRGRRNFRNNRRCGPSKKFHNIQKDEKGRPMIMGATNNSFNPFKVALQKKNTKNTVIKKEKQEVTKKNEGFKQTKMTDIEKQMILNMQYETDSEQEEEDEDDISEEDDN